MPEPRKSAPVLKAVGLCMGFGLTLAAEIYGLGILAGGWLDNKFGTAPWCMLAGVLLAIVLAFWQLLYGLDFLREREERNGGNPTGGEDKRA